MTSPEDFYPTLDTYQSGPSRLKQRVLTDLEALGGAVLECTPRKLTQGIHERTEQGDPRVKKLRQRMGTLAASIVLLTGIYGIPESVRQGIVEDGITQLGHTIAKAFSAGAHQPVPKLTPVEHPQQYDDKPTAEPSFAQTCGIYPVATDEKPMCPSK